MPFRLLLAESRDRLPPERTFFASRKGDTITCGMKSTPLRKATYILKDSLDLKGNLHSKGKLRLNGRTYSNAQSECQAQCCQSMYMCDVGHKYDVTSSPHFPELTT